MHFIQGFIRKTVGTIDARVAFEGIAIVVDLGTHYSINGVELPKDQVEYLQPVNATRVTLDLSKYQLTITSQGTRAPAAKSPVDEIVTTQRIKLEAAMREMRRARAVFDPQVYLTKFQDRADMFKVNYAHALRNNESGYARRLTREFAWMTQSLILDVYDEKTAAQRRREFSITFRT